MNNSFMQLDEQAANDAGVGVGISESGAYVGKIKTKMVTAKTGAKGIEFSLETSQGDANYLTLYYQKACGDNNQMGYNAVQAIMFCCGVSQTSVTQNPIPDDNGEMQYYIPELEGKSIGLVLQKVLYSKADGGDGYKFDILMPFKAQSRQTASEITSRAQAQTVDKIVANLKDKDERQQIAQAPAYERAQHNATASRPVSKFDQVSQNQNVAQTQQLPDDDFPY